MDHKPSRIEPLPLVTDFAEVHIAGIRTDLQHRSPTIERSLCRHRLWSPGAPFTGDMNIREVASDRVSIGDFDLRPDGDREIIGQIDGDVAGRGFKTRVVAASARR